MRNVIVTGGSKGLGLGIARKLASTGFRVISIARRESAEVTAAIQQADAVRPGSFHFVPFDLALTEGIGDLVKTTRKTFGPIFGLVNNAGMSIEGILATTQDSQIEKLVRLNTLSPMIMTKYVVRTMMADGGGRIVNISSIIASTGYSGLAAYGATKASLNGFTRSLAREVGRAGINVNAVAPGFIETDMTKGLNEEQKQKIAGRSALRRLADVDDVASAVDFLLSDGAKSITGTVLTVDAGNTA
jgi:3-oxoacyl-[acyl-carrier protein] reductase